MPRDARLAECADCGVGFPSLLYVPLENCAQVVRQVLAGNLTVPKEHRQMVIDLVDCLCSQLAATRCKNNELHELVRKFKSPVA
jgi:hypothetical protein